MHITSVFFSNFRADRNIHFDFVPTSVNMALALKMRYAFTDVRSCNASGPGAVGHIDAALLCTMEVWMHHLWTLDFGLLVASGVVL